MSQGRYFNAKYAKGEGRNGRMIYWQNYWEGMRRYLISFSLPLRLSFATFALESLLFMEDAGGYLTTNYADPPSADKNDLLAKLWEGSERDLGRMIMGRMMGGDVAERTENNYFDNEVSRVNKVIKMRQGESELLFNFNWLTFPTI